MDFPAEIALPVVGVLVCALLVFAFGFKSPGQPPSFDFEDDRKKARRNKQKTSRSQTGNGHIPANVDEVPTKTASGSKSPKAASSSTSSASPSTSKLNPSSKTESRKAAKKAASSVKPVTDENKAKTPPENSIDEEGWMTQTSKKGKKQRGKKEDWDVSEKKSSREESWEPVTMETKEPEVMPEQPDSPPLEKRKKKSRKTLKHGAQEESASPDISGEPVEAGVVEQPAVEEEIPSLVIDATQDLETCEDLEEIHMQMTEAEEEIESKPQKQKNKKREIFEDFEIPDVYTKPVVEPVAVPLQKSKSPKKSKKEKKLESQANKPEPSKKDKTPDILPTKESASTPSTEEKQLSEAMEDLPSQPVISPENNQPESASSAPTTENVTFDELGDSWVEAKVKAKKKKARREN